MKKILAVILAVWLICLPLAFTGCEENSSEPVSEGKPQTQNTTDGKADDKAEKSKAPEASEPQVEEPEKEEEKNLKILSIGNSFSVDAQEYLYGIAKDAGFDNIVLGNLYMGGCSLYGHWNSYNTDAAGYIYYKNTTGTWEETQNVSLMQGLVDEEWDYITLQQQSGNSGKSDTYEPYLSNLINIVNANKRNPDAKLVWHMTWAYAQDTAQVAFADYDNDQMKMYEKIVEAAETMVDTNEGMDFVIPSGTAIQNARTSYLGDTLCRDGFHLDLTYGRYLAGLTWIHKITGKDIDGISYIPDNSFDENVLEVLKECAKNAVKRPYRVTNSKHTVAPYNLDDYTQLELGIEGKGYYNSEISMSPVTDDENSDYYVYTRVFSRDELPVGSIIVVDEGYRYRPEGWKSETEMNTKITRPSSVVTNEIKIDEEWWGGFNFRAFNVSYRNEKTDVSDEIEEMSSHFRIYVPEN